LVLRKSRQPLAVPHSGRARIELVETVLQVLGPRGGRMGLEGELGGHAGLTRLNMTASEGPVGNSTRLRSTPSRRAPTFSATRWLRVLPIATTISSRFRSGARNAYAATSRTAAGATPRPAAEVRTQ